MGGEEPAAVGGLWGRGRAWTGLAGSARGASHSTGRRNGILSQNDCSPNTEAAVAELSITQASDWGSSHNLPRGRGDVEKRFQLAGPRGSCVPETSELCVCVGGGDVARDPLSVMGGSPGERSPCPCSSDEGQVLKGTDATAGSTRPQRRKAIPKVTQGGLTESRPRLELGPVPSPHPSLGLPLA